MSGAIDLKKFRAKKKEVGDSKNFRRNYMQLDSWDKAFFDQYHDTRKSMLQLFKLVNQEWRSADDHLPVIVRMCIESIMKDLDK